MNPAVPTRRIRGIVPPLATPLAAIDALDVPGLERLVEHILGGGVDALFILGTTGEGPALSYRVRRELIERVCQQVGQRVPVLVGISDAAYAESLHVAEIAARAGAAVNASPTAAQIPAMTCLRCIARPPDSPIASKSIRRRYGAAGKD